MPTPAISTLSLTKVPVVAESPAGVASLVGTAGTEASFAAVFQGQAGSIASQATPTLPGAQPQPGALDLSAFPQPADIQPAADLLPVAAETGKILPVPGKAAANGETSEALPTAAIAPVMPTFTALIATPVKFAKAAGLDSADDAGADGMTGDCQLLDPALDPSVFAIAQPSSLVSAASPFALDPATLGVAQATPSIVASTTLVDVALRKAPGTKPDIAAQGNAIVPAPQASVQTALADESTTPATGASGTPTGAAQAAPAAGMIAVSIAATPIVAAVSTEQAIKAITPAERGGQPSASVSSTAQVAAPAPVANDARGEASQQGAGEDAPRHAVSSAATVSTPSASAGDLFSAIPSTPVVAAVDRAAATPTAAALPAMPAATPDRADAVAQVVDRLMAAREVGMGSLASIAIANRDFGDLTVSFSDNGNSLDVSVTAADADKQRALAAALSTAERPVAREPATQATQSSQNTSATMQHDRNAEGQLARDSGGRQPRGETLTEQRRAGHAASPATESETAAPERSGIYV